LQKVIRSNTITFYVLQVSSPGVFVEKFSYILNQYLNALRGIVPIFNYMVNFFLSKNIPILRVFLLLSKYMFHLNLIILKYMMFHKKDNAFKQH